MSNLPEGEVLEDWKTVLSSKKEPRQYRPVYYSFFRPTDLFRCVAGIPGKNQVIAVLNNRSERPVRRGLRTTLDMNDEEIRILFGGFLQASRKRADEVRMTEHHGSLRSRKEFHVHFLFSGSDFAEVCPQSQDRFKLQELENSRRAKLMEWATKDLESCIHELSKPFSEGDRITGPESDIVRKTYHLKHARVFFSTSCDFFGFFRTFLFVKKYIEYFELKNFHLIVSHDYIQIAMTCDEYVKHTLMVKGIDWVRNWISGYETAFREGDVGAFLDS